MEKPKSKTNNIIIRVSDADKALLKELADKRGMAMSELVTYLIRREADFDKLGLRMMEK